MTIILRMKERKIGSEGAEIEEKNSGGEVKINLD